MVTKPNIFTDGQLPSGPQWDANFSTLYDYLNGNIEASSIVSASGTTSKFNDGTITAGKIATDVDFSNTQEFCFQIDAANDPTSVNNFRRRKEIGYDNYFLIDYDNVVSATGEYNGRNGELLFFPWFIRTDAFETDIVGFTQTISNAAGGGNQFLTMTGSNYSQGALIGATGTRYFTMKMFGIYSLTDSSWIFLGAGHYNSTTAPL